MDIHQNASSGASGGPAGVFLPDRAETFTEALNRIRSLRGAMCEAIADAIDQLDALDALESDPDLEAVNEDGGDILNEPHDEWEEDGDSDLGAAELVTCPDDGPVASPTRRSRQRQRPAVPVLKVDRSCDQANWAQGDRTGFDWEHDTSDEEPSLGSVGSYSPERASQVFWAIPGDTGEREEENEHGAESGRSDDGEEPSLGATTAVNQVHAWAGPRDGMWCAPVDGEPSLGWTGHGRGHPEMALRGYDEDREHDPLEGNGDEQDDDARGHPHVPSGIGLDGLCASQMIVGRVVEGGGIAPMAHVGAPEVANG